MVRVLSLVLIVFAVGCQAQDESVSSKAEIVGNWSVEQLIANGGDITQSMACKLDPSCEPPDHGWYEFTPEGQYILHHDDPAQREEGRWTYKSETRYNALLLERDGGDDLSWIVSIEGATMTWKGVEEKAFWERTQDAGWPPETNGFEIVFARR